VTHKIKRDRYFWTVALQTVCVNIFLGSFGPSQPLLRADQGTSLTVAGLHGTALGIASILAGSFNSRLAHRFGRSNSTWIGIAIFCIGLIAIVASPTVYFSIPAALVAGIGVSITINNALTAITGHYHEMAPMALTQANAIASCGYVAGTLIVGNIANNFRDYWRFGMLGTGMALGRWYGGRILKSLELDQQLKIFILLQGAGFSILWFSHSLLLSFIGILIAGLGMSNQFALGALRGIGFSENRPDLAIGKISLAAGVAIAGSPFLLGILGDSFGISRAYLMVPILIALSYLAVKIAPSHVPHKILEENEL